MQKDAVLKEIKGGGGWLTLNRPEALNAMNDDLFIQFSEALNVWEKDDRIKFVIIAGKGRAFCAGGDLTSIEKISNFSTEGIEDFLTNEFGLNLYIYNYSKPYVSILNGITMGGGMGLSIHGKYRIITEHTLMAMPETSIGFFPDVGGAHFLNQCHGKIGLYLGLTGSRITPADAIHTGLGTHFVPSGNLDQLYDAIVENEGNDLADILDNHHIPPEGESFLKNHRELIDQHFGQSSIEDIFRSLATDQSNFAIHTLKRLREMCPNSLRETFKHLETAKHMTMEQVRLADVNLARDWLSKPESTAEWIEGIRAAVIDKDHKPKWTSQPITY